MFRSVRSSASPNPSSWNWSSSVAVDSISLCKSRRLWRNLPGSSVGSMASEGMPSLRNRMDVFARSCMKGALNLTSCLSTWRLGR